MAAGAGRWRDRSARIVGVRCAASQPATGSRRLTEGEGAAKSENLRPLALALARGICYGPLRLGKAAPELGHLHSDAACASPYASRKYSAIYRFTGPGNGSRCVIDARPRRAHTLPPICSPAHPAAVNVDTVPERSFCVPRLDWDSRRGAILPRLRSILVKIVYRLDLHVR